MFTRREMFKGLTLGAGNVLLAPILHEIQAHADGVPVRPKRFVFMLQSQGLQSWAVKPTEVQRNDRTGVERVVTRPLAPLTLPEDLLPLNPFKDRLTIIQGLNGRHVSPYHGGPYGALGGFRKGETPRQQTIDAALARVHTGTFPLVGLGIGPYTNTQYCSSAWGPNQAAPIMCNPDYAYRVLFGSVLRGQNRIDFDSRSGILDFMRNDVRQVQDRLAGPERERFDAYVNAFDTMSRRQQELQNREAELRAVAPNRDERFTTERETLQIQAHVELAAAALIGGLTRVVTICSGMCSAGYDYRGFEAQPISLHNQLGHGAGGRSRELYTLLRRYHLEQLASLARRLQAVREGDGTMLDNTVFVYTSDFGESHHSTGSDWAFVLLGNLGGRLRAGQYVDYPLVGHAGNRSINALYCTLLHAAAAPRDHFNLDGAQRAIDVPGPLNEILP